MKREQALQRISQHEEDLRRLKVRSLSVFGSLARDEAQEGSDIDLLVEFSEPVGMFEFIRLKQYLEQILGVPVDLATPEALKKQLREGILKEAVRAA